MVQSGRAGASILAGDAMRRLADCGLAAHELGDAFHTIAKHIGKTDDELYARLLAEPDKKFSSTFANLADAERYTYANLTANEAKINAFLLSDKQTERLDLVFDHPVGRTVMRELREPLESTAVVTRLRKDASMPNGYRIVTSFPDVG